MLDGVGEAVRKINLSGYLAIVATNQPVIARGEVTVEGLQEIHNKMETMLGKEGAYLDGIYYCPHHPDKGFDGEVKELKIVCECRKPKAGLAGKNAGCKTALIGESDYGQNLRVTSLLNFVKNGLLCNDDNV